MNGNDAIETIDQLLRELKEDPEHWENPTLERYLDAMRAWLNDSKNKNLEQPSWDLIVQMLRAAKIYE